MGWRCGAPGSVPAGKVRTTTSSLRSLRCSGSSARHRAVRCDGSGVEDVRRRFLAYSFPPRSPDPLEVRDLRYWLARRPRFHLHFTPTGSSWINQVERWFGYLTDQMIRRGAHKSVQALEADIRTWIENWNADPKPFTWTKTAEEILNSLARYIARISGAEH